MCCVRTKLGSRDLFLSTSVRDYWEDSVLQVLVVNASVQISIFLELCTMTFFPVDLITFFEILLVAAHDAFL